MLYFGNTIYYMGNFLLLFQNIKMSNDDIREDEVTYESFCDGLKSVADDSICVNLQEMTLQSNWPDNTLVQGKLINCIWLFIAERNPSA